MQEFECIKMTRVCAAGKILHIGQLCDIQGISLIPWLNFYPPQWLKAKNAGCQPACLWFDSSTCQAECGHISVSSFPGVWHSTTRTLENSDNPATWGRHIELEKKTKNLTYKRTHSIQKGSVNIALSQWGICLYIH